MEPLEQALPQAIEGQEPRPEMLIPTGALGEWRREYRDYNGDYGLEPRVWDIRAVVGVHSPTPP